MTKFKVQLAISGFFFYIYIETYEFNIAATIIGPALAKAMDAVYIGVEYANYQ